MFKKAFFIFILFCLFVPLSSFSQEALTIVTYYSSPNGVYDKLSVQATAVQTLGVGDTNGDANYDINDAPDPATESGQAWISGGVSVGNASTEGLVNVAWNTAPPERSIAIFESGPAAGDIQLHVRQDAGLNRIELQAQDGSNTPQSLVFNQNGGAVGIGKDNPATDLDIYGNLNISETLQIKGNISLTTTCDDSTEGIIMFEKSTGTFWGCDGNGPGWRDLKDPPPPPPE